MRIEVGDAVKVVHGEHARSTGEVKEVATGVKVELDHDQTARWFRSDDLVVVG